MYYSASQLGSLLGFSAQQINAALRILGYIEGTPGHYCPTEKGKAFFQVTYHDNGYGGYARRCWETYCYDESIVVPLRQELSVEGLLRKI